MLRRLVVRIWLAIVVSFAVLAFLVALAWRLAAEPPLTELVVRDETGQVVGIGEAHHAQNGPEGNRPAPFGLGPEFIVQMEDGSVLHMHLPLERGGPWHAPFGFLWLLAVVAVAVALATYPVVRRLTSRLEILRRSVERWGSGNLGARVAVDGSDEIGFLAERFNHAAARIETLVADRDALLAAQKSLLANASHELRSPLARIRMGLEMMQQAPTPSTTAEIVRNINELDHLIEEILLASRLDAREVDLGTVEAVELIGLAAEECALTGALLQTGLSALEVPGVSRLLRRAIRNLLENAARHGQGAVTLTARLDDGYAELRVCDAGPGVPAELRQRIFDPFYRLPGASERQGSVGLGLALVRSIALRHQGSVECIDAEGGGACFILRLPVLVTN